MIFFNVNSDRTCKKIDPYSLILNEFSCGKVQTPCNFCHSASHRIRVVFKHGVFSHKLEQYMKITAFKIKALGYSVATNKYKVLSTLPHKNSFRIKKMMNIFLPRSVRIQVQNNCKNHAILRPEIVLSSKALILYMAPSWNYAIYFKVVVHMNFRYYIHV